jgi:hypothetical protein
MTIHVTKKTDLYGLQRLIWEASYSGERIIIQRDDGIAIGIVPLEYINTLEKMEGNLSQND